MKKILLFLLLALPASAQTNFVVTNFVPAMDTNWFTNVIPKLNANYTAIVGWLNAHNAANTTQAARIAALETGLTTNSTFTNSVVFYSKVEVRAGFTSPSNTWSLFEATNGMKPGDIRFGINSNGCNVFDILMSNSTPILRPYW